MKHSIRSKVTGRFIPKKKAPKQIVAGRLYEYKGTVVRAKKVCSNGLWFISSHKKLNGFAKPEELTVIDKSKVKDYLEHA